jgi:hypothetical protein
MLQVFAQPLQLRRVGSIFGFDMSTTNQWHWRPDYEVVELAQCRYVGVMSRVYGHIDVPH